MSFRAVEPGTIEWNGMKVAVTSATISTEPRMVDFCLLDGTLGSTMASYQCMVDLTGVVVPDKGRKLLAGEYECPSCRSIIADEWWWSNVMCPGCGSPKVAT